MVGTLTPEESREGITSPRAGSGWQEYAPSSQDAPQIKYRTEEELLRSELSQQETLVRLPDGGWIKVSKDLVAKLEKLKNEGAEVKVGERRNLEDYVNNVLNSITDGENLKRAAMNDAMELRGFLHRVTNFAEQFSIDQPQNLDRLVGRERIVAEINQYRARRGEPLLEPTQADIDLVRANLAQLQSLADRFEDALNPRSTPDPADRRRKVEDVTRDIKDALEAAKRSNSSYFLNDVAKLSWTYQDSERLRDTQNPQNLETLLELIGKSSSQEYAEGGRYELIDSKTGEVNFHNFQRWIVDELTYWSDFQDDDQVNTYEMLRINTDFRAITFFEILAWEPKKFFRRRDQISGKNVDDSRYRNFGNYLINMFTPAGAVHNWAMDAIAAQNNEKAAQEFVAKTVNSDKLFFNRRFYRFLNLAASTKEEVDKILDGKASTSMPKEGELDGSLGLAMRYIGTALRHIPDLAYGDLDFAKQDAAAEYYRTTLRARIEAVKKQMADIKPGSSYDPRRKRELEKELSALREYDKRNAFLNALGSTRAREAFFQNFINELMSQEFDKYFQGQSWGGLLEQRIGTVDVNKPGTLGLNREAREHVYQAIKGLGPAGLAFKEGALNQFDPAIRGQLQALQQEIVAAMQGALHGRFGGDKTTRLMQSLSQRNYGKFVQDFIDSKNKYLIDKATLNIYTGAGKDTKRKFNGSIVRSSLTAALKAQYGEVPAPKYNPDGSPALDQNGRQELTLKGRLTDSDVAFAVEHAWFFPFWMLVAASNDQAASGTNWLARIMSPAQFRESQIGSNAFGEYETILSLLHTQNLWDGLHTQAIDRDGKSRKMTMGEFFQGGEGADVDYGRYKQGDFTERTGSTWYQYQFEGAIQTWELLSKELEFDIGSFIVGEDAYGRPVINAKKAQAAYKVLNSMHNLLRKYPPLYDREVRAWVPKRDANGVQSGFEMKTMTIREYMLHSNVLSLAEGVGGKNIFQKRLGSDKYLAEGWPEAKMMFAQLVIDSMRMHTGGRVMRTHWSQDQLMYMAAFMQYMPIGGRKMIDPRTGMEMIAPLASLFSDDEITVMLHMAGLPSFAVMELKNGMATGTGVFWEMFWVFFQQFSKAVLSNK